MTTHRLASFLLIALTAGTPLSLRAADAQTGETIYKNQCASCHGAAGEGAKKYPKPLIGERSVAQLAKLIGKTMPEEDPGSLSAEEAQAVAAYVHETFYSVTARERNKPARIELARLTVRQYRNAVADLIGSFRAPLRWEKEGGLRGEYFKGRRFRNEDRVADRTDPQVQFDYGIESPIPDKMDPHEFSMRWSGSILAPETGEYEFVVRTEHAARLWLNDNNRPLIDAWVKSGNEKEHKGTIFLVGGRAYPLRLEYTKAKQGVDDSKKTPKKPPAPSSIALEWKAPRRAAEAVPDRNLSPVNTPESFVLVAPFPPDDRSYGWERGTTISREWDEAVTEAAVETAGYVAARIDALANTKDGAPDRDAKVRAFCRTFAGRAFRRPLTDDQAKLFIDHQFEVAANLETAVKRVVLLTMKSPRFLYREVGDKPDGYDTAARLSFGLWDSLPDGELLAAAAAGKLSDRPEVARQADRMLADPRARAKLRAFLLTWLKVDQVADVAKDAKRYPGFDANIVSDLRTSLELFLDDVVWTAGSDFRRLLLEDRIYLNGRLAGFYQAELPDIAEFQKVKLEPGPRAGVLTHPYMMTRFAYTGQTSPIHRGVFLARGVLGLAMRPPPEAFTPLSPDLHPTLTTRERVTLQTKATACISCHGVINPLGFTLENFDAVGRYREQDNAKPVDSVGSYLTRSGKTATFAGPRELAEFLAESEEVHDSFVEQMFHHVVQQSVRAYGPNTLAELRRSFAANGFSIRKLAVEVATTAAMKPRGGPTAEAPGKPAEPKP
jgi:cytochrome c553